MQSGVLADGGSVWQPRLRVRSGRRSPDVAVSSDLRARRVVAVVLAGVVLAGACSGAGDGDDPEDGAPPALPLALESGAVVQGDETVVPASGDGGREAAAAWRDAPFDVEVKGGGAYLGHELLTSPDERSLPWEPEGVELSTEAVDEHTLRVTATAPPGATQLSVSFGCRPDERFYGLGAQSWATQHRGQTVPIWVVEQGLGKITPETPQPAPSVMGEPYDSYAPIPFFLSSEHYGVSYRGDAYATFELCTEDHPDTWRLETWDDQLVFDVLRGDEPLDVVAAYTATVGRPSAPPDWFYAPMNDAVRGQDNVARVARLIRANDIPSSVMWTEDWIGIGSQQTGFRLSHDWDVSETEYPDLRSLTDDLHAEGFRFLGYFSPFIPTDETTPGGPSVDQNGNPVVLQPHNQEKWAEAVAGGYAFTDEAGDPYLMLTPPFVPPGGAALDVTQEDAVAWFRGYLEEAEALGLDGSMTDFGEWVPFDAVFDDGRTGAEVHNVYPVLWQQIHRDFWEQARPDGDYLFYVRSAYTGSQAAAPAIWGGDQNTSFDRLDGLASVITLGVNLGVTGMAFYGHDIAGYSAFAIDGVENEPTGRELFLRWAAVGAYTPLMRTHHGSRYGENWSFEGAPNPERPEQPIPDERTLEAWKALATEHIRLFPYLSSYGAEAVERGVPIMRHPILRYPDDPVFAGTLPDEPAWDAFASVGLPSDETFEYFLGDELLVAPIIDEGATDRPVHLPEGTWYDIRTGERFQGPGTITATAAPGEIPVFAPAGAIVPRLPAGVETLVPTDEEEVVDNGDVADQLDLDVHLGADGRFELADGTTIELVGAVGADEPEVTVDGEPLDVRVTPRGRRVVTPEAESVELRIGGATLTITGAPLARTYTIDLIG